MKKSMLYTCALAVTSILAVSAVEAQTVAMPAWSSAKIARMRNMQAYVAPAASAESIRVYNTTRALEDGSASGKGSGPFGGSPNGG